MKPQVYPSGMDIWLAATLVLAPVVAIGFGIYLMFRGETDAWIAVSTGVLMALVIAAFSIPCRYTIFDKELHIKCGVMETRVPIASIKKVLPTSNPLSAPALSLRRVQIDTIHRSYLISPRDRDAFINALELKINASSSSSPSATT